MSTNNLPVCVQVLLRRVKEIIIVFLAVVVCCAWWDNLDIRIRVAMAEDQIQFFDEVVQSSVQKKSVEEIPSGIEAIRIYYPSGSKQRTGSHLDRMVERARTNAITKLEEQAARLRTESKGR